MHYELKFVLRHYKRGAFSPKQAYRRFCREVGIVSPWQRYRWWLAAASVALIAGLFGLYQWQWQPHTLMAKVGQQVYVLADGTHVTLAPGSSLSYRGTDCRKVSIEGKAFLAIKHDANNPFLVSDRHYIIHDIGTKLTIEEQGTQTVVAVTEGSVLFAAKNHEQEGIVLRQGQGAILHHGDAAPLPAFAVSPNTAAWATHKFHFADTPLTQVLNDLETYYNVRLTASDTTKHLTGDFQTENLSDMLDIIEKVLDVRIEEKK
ncbi:MAG: FecR family protein [Prevotella sp.]|jgi:transmembrane sensor